MSSLMETLATIHRLYAQVERYEAQIEEGPRSIDAARTELARLRQEAAAGQEEIKRLKMDIDKKSLILKEKEEAVGRSDPERRKIKSNKEYQALELERETAKLEARKLEDDILGIMGKLDAAEEQAAACEEQIQQQEARIHEQQADWQTRRETLATSVASTRAELATAIEALPGGARPEFRRVTAARGSDGLASAAGNVCQGCYSTLTQQIVNSLMLDRDLVPCMSCGRILYPEGA